MGRGALSNPPGRFALQHAIAEDDGWGSLDEPLPPLATTVLPEPACSVITRNASPDVPFVQSINPYRGCEHGCVYCFARPAHAFVDLSPGLDFETRLFYKQDAAARLREEISRPRYRCAPIALGTNTDPYQPIERRYRVTRSILELMLECDHPVSIVTKSALVLRDLDLLAELARRRLTRVYVSVTTLDDDLKRRMEPRAASSMAYILLRLPREVRELFHEWLERHFPDRSARVRSRIRELRGGLDNDSQFGSRMRGTGPWADLLRVRFDAACRRSGIAWDESDRFDASRFRPPRPQGGQLLLW